MKVCLMTNRWIMIIHLFILFFVGSFIVQQTEVEAVESFDVEAESAILVDSKTGKILFEKNANESLPPASMSKMMAEYLVFEAIDQGKFEWDTLTVTSEYGNYVASLSGTSSVFLAQGEERTVEELYTALAVDSSNDATVVLAELVAGNEQNFVQLMNDKAEEFGMTDTHFVNSTGLPNRMLGSYVPEGVEDSENLMSARDTAILAYKLVNDFPQIHEFASILEKEADYINIYIDNRNWMLEGHPKGSARPYGYQGLDGLKTGYTELAQYCFTGTAERDGKRFISVVMGSESATSRFVETAKLLDYGFDHFIYEEMIQEGDVLADYDILEVSKGKQKEVHTAMGDSLETMIHQDEVDLYSLEFVPDSELFDENGLVMAPIANQDILGEVNLVYTGDINYGFLPVSGVTESVSLIALDEVEQAGWIRLFFRSIGEFFGGIWSSLVDGVKGWFS